MDTWLVRRRGSHEIRNRDLHATRRRRDRRSAGEKIHCSDCNGKRIAMRCRWGSALCFAILASTAYSAIASNDDGGGRDVSIALFSTQRVRAVTITPFAGHSWTASCASCSHRPLITPLHLAASAELFAGGNLRVTNDATGESRSADGLWHLRANAGEIDVVLVIPS